MVEALGLWLPIKRLEGRLVVDIGVAKEQQGLDGSLLLQELASAGCLIAMCSVSLILSCALFEKRDLSWLGNPILAQEKT